MSKKGKVKQDVDIQAVRKRQSDFEFQEHRLCGIGTDIVQILIQHQLTVCEANAVLERVQQTLYRSVQAAPFGLPLRCQAVRSDYVCWNDALSDKTENKDNFNNERS